VALGTKWLARLPQASLSHDSKSHHINYIFTVNTPILYIILLT
jgi:hypothetical protein